VTIAKVIARSSLRAIAFVSTPLRSVSTHIHRPYCADGHIRLSSLGRCSVVALRLSLLGRRCGRLRSRQNSAALRFGTHIHRPYSRRYRVGCNVVLAYAVDIHWSRAAAKYLFSIIYSLLSIISGEINI
jgi:hypothetical protein